MGFGRNLAIDQRWAVTSFGTAQQLGAELLGLAPDVVLCAGSPGVKAMQKATTTVPIVFILVAEPVDKGFVQSLSHPGRNITGFALSGVGDWSEVAGAAFRDRAAGQAGRLHVPPEGGSVCPLLLRIRPGRRHDRTFAKC